MLQWLFETATRYGVTAVITYWSIDCTREIVFSGNKTTVTKKCSSLRRMSRSVIIKLTALLFFLKYSFLASGCNLVLNQLVNNSEVV